MNPVKEFFAWEIELIGHRVIRQYNEDGSENPSSTIPADQVVRASILHRAGILPRHDILLDHPRGERFVRRFGRGFEKRTETNIEHILALYKYIVVDGKPRKVDYSIGPDGVVEPVDEYRPEDVSSLGRYVSIGAALTVMELAEASSFDEFLLRLRCADKSKPFASQSPFYRGLAKRYGLNTPMGDILTALSLERSKPLGAMLDSLGFPKKESHFEYLHCLQTTHYRLWVFSSSGQSLVTNPEYELYL